MADSVTKQYNHTIQINSKTKITEQLYDTYKAAIESAWTGKQQKITRVGPGGGKSIFVTFENKKQASDAFKAITDGKIKYWDEMSTFYMINFNV